MLMSCHQWIDETTSMKSASIKLMHVHQLMMVPQWRHVSLYINNLSEKKAHLIWTSLQYNLHIPTTTPAAILLHNNSLMTFHQFLYMGVTDGMLSIDGTSSIDIITWTVTPPLNLQPYNTTLTSWVRGAVAPLFRVSLAVLALQCVDQNSTGSNNVALMWH